MERNSTANATAPHATPLNNHQDNPSQPTLDVERPSTTSAKSEQDVPPDGGYGWVCVACNFAINGSTWGINSSYAVFLAYYLSHDYFPNTSPLAYAFIGGLSISMAVFIAPLATFIISLYGTKVCLHIGVFFETLALIGSSFTTQEYQIILSQGICFGLGVGFLFVGSVGVIPQWFQAKRSVANAVAAAGSGLGGLIWSLSTQAMIDNLGIPWTFRVLGILTFAINLTASNLLRDRNAQVGARHHAFDLSILKRPEFMILIGWSAFSIIGYTIVLFSLPSYSVAIGLTAKQGSIIGAVLNLGQMCGRPFIGLASDRWGRINLAALFTFLCGVFCFIFWIPSEAAPIPMGLLAFFALVGGCLAGTFWTTIAPVSAEIVGLKDLPSALSLTWTMMVIPTTCAEPIALELRRTGVRHWIYLHAQVFTGCMYIGGALFLWVLRGWKVGELEEAKRRSERASDTTVVNDTLVPGTLVAGGEKQVRETGSSTLQRERSASIAKQGWNGRDLFRRMCTVMIV